MKAFNNLIFYVLCADFFFVWILLNSFRFVYKREERERKTQIRGI